MLIINESDIAKLTDPIELTHEMVKAMQIYAAGDYIMPERMHMDMDKNTLLLMPAYSGMFFGTKLVTLFPDNPKVDLPVLNGTVILNDASNGKPLAMLNGAKLTAVRTAAVGSAGVVHTCPENSSTLGVIGVGVQGLHQIQFICSHRPIKQVLVLDRFRDRLDPFIGCMNALLPGVEIRAAANSQELCEKTEIIVTATNSESPVLPDDPNVLRGKHIIAIGSYKEKMRELPDSLFSLVEKVYVDVEHAVKESGDLIQPIRQNILREENICLLSDLFDHPTDTSQTSLYKSVGMALFDLVAAEYVYEKALQMNAGTKINF